ncbi:unnamed protein product [Zymoseptoria tritici ST99CH_3D7]|uniref:Uncharacterized protein n=1 Tax=Zymoseptoria tritici (strain ST99CH_3D7) TaxID=1276538 RepID=A0A1X7S2M5_ZYMT9|nr:unnamed protein product [Zymoseptoria tritici ST99CH_3D7]
MPSLLDLPDEILEDILIAVPARTAPSNPDVVREAVIATHPTYHAFALTCKRLLFLTRPHLYYSIAIKKTPERQHDLRCLARTLCEAPHLRELVRRLDIPRCNSTIIQDDGLRVRDKALYRDTLLQVAGFSARNEMILDALKWHCSAAYTAVLMFLLPRLEILTIDWKSKSSDCYTAASCMEDLAGGALRTLKALRLGDPTIPMEALGMQSLQRCTLVHVSPVTLARLMSLPAMRTVEASLPRLGGDDRARRAPRIKSPRSDVTTLVLSDTAMRPSWVESTIRNCRSLKRFSYDLVSPVEPSMKLSDPAELFACLNKHRLSLETLRIVDYTERAPSFVLGNGMTALAHFDRLQHLEIDELALFGQDAETLEIAAERLPLGLRSFTLRTQAWACRMPTKLDQLSILQHRSLETLIISSPVEWLVERWTATRTIDRESSEVLRRLNSASYRGQDLFIARSIGKPVWHNVQHDGQATDHVEIQCRRLLKLGSATLEEMAGMIRVQGLKNLIKSQMRTPRVWPNRTPPVWKQEIIFGEALMSVFEEVDFDEEEAEADIEEGLCHS